MNEVCLSWFSSKRFVKLIVKFQNVKQPVSVEHVGHASVPGLKAASRRGVHRVRLYTVFSVIGTLKNNKTRDLFDMPDTLLTF